MDRIYTQILKNHLQNDLQMIFLAGARQVGKTTLSKSIDQFGYDYKYLNWDDQADKQLILSGTSTVIESINLPKVREKLPVIIFDEIHKYHEWKNFLKGFYDKYNEKVKIIVTGSAKLDIYRKGSDSMMGRYFLYRIHPFSVSELLRPNQLPSHEITEPTKPQNDLLDKLLIYGGYPAPFSKQDEKFKNRWQQLKSQQLFKEDILELTNIHEIALLEQLAFQLAHCCGSIVNQQNLSKKLQVAATTVKYWLSVLELSYYCFFISPWSKNISRSLLKAPKVYLWDWSQINDEGKRLENLVALHLLKAVHFWTDCGYGTYGLYYLRNKDQVEVDFLVTKNNEPWFLVEVKSSDEHLSHSLVKFHHETKAKHAFQVVKKIPYQAVNCFDYFEPIVVSLETFLSQLV